MILTEGRNQRHISVATPD